MKFPKDYVFWEGEEGLKRLAGRFSSGVEEEGDEKRPFWCLGGTFFVRKVEKGTVFVRKVTKKDENRPKSCREDKNRPG